MTYIMGIKQREVLLLSSKVMAPEKDYCTFVLELYEKPEEKYFHKKEDCLSPFL